MSDPVISEYDNGLMVSLKCDDCEWAYVIEGVSEEALKAAKLLLEHSMKYKHQCGVDGVENE